MLGMEPKDGHVRCLGRRLKTFREGEVGKKEGKIETTKGSSEKGRL